MYPTDNDVSQLYPSVVEIVIVRPGPREQRLRQPLAHVNDRPIVTRSKTQQMGSYYHHNNTFLPSIGSQNVHNSQSALKAINIPMTVIRGFDGSVIKTDTIWQRLLALARMRVHAGMPMIDAEDWRLPHVHAPSRPDYTRFMPFSLRRYYTSTGMTPQGGFPLGWPLYISPMTPGMARMQRVHQQQVYQHRLIQERRQTERHQFIEQQQKAFSEAQIEVDRKRGQGQAYWPPDSSLRVRGGYGSHTFNSGYSSLSQFIRPSVEARKIDVGMPAFSKPGQSRGYPEFSYGTRGYWPRLCYGCRKQSTPHFHFSKTIRTGGGFTYVKRDLPKLANASNNPLHWYVVAPPSASDRSERIKMRKSAGAATTSKRFPPKLRRQRTQPTQELAGESVRLASMDDVVEIPSAEIDEELKALEDDQDEEIAEIIAHGTESELLEPGDEPGGLMENLTTGQLDLSDSQPDLSASDLTSETQKNTEGISLTLHLDAKTPRPVSEEENENAMVVLVQHTAETAAAEEEQMALADSLWAEKANRALSSIERSSLGGAESLEIQAMLEGEQKAEVTEEDSEAAVDKLQDGDVEVHTPAKRPKHSRGSSEPLVPVTPPIVTTGKEPSPSPPPPKLPSPPPKPESPPKTSVDDEMSSSKAATSPLPLSTHMPSVAETPTQEVSTAMSSSSRRDSFIHRLLQETIQSDYTLLTKEEEELMRLEQDDKLPEPAVISRELSRASAPRSSGPARSATPSSQPSLPKTPTTPKTPIPPSTPQKSQPVLPQSRPKLSESTRTQSSIQSPVSQKSSAPLSRSQSSRFARTPASGSPSVKTSSTTPVHREQEEDFVPFEKRNIDYKPLQHFEAQEVEHHPASPMRSASQIVPKPRPIISSEELKSPPPVVEKAVTPPPPSKEETTVKEEPEIAKGEKEKKVQATKEKTKPVKELSPPEGEDEDDISPLTDSNKRKGKGKAKGKVKGKTAKFEPEPVAESLPTPPPAAAAAVWSETEEIDRKSDMSHIETTPVPVSPAPVEKTQSVTATPETNQVADAVQVRDTSRTGTSIHSEVVGSEEDDEGEFNYLVEDDDYEEEDGIVDGDTAVAGIGDEAAVPEKKKLARAQVQRKTKNRLGFDYTEEELRYRMRRVKVGKGKKEQAVLEESDDSAGGDAIDLLSKYCIIHLNRIPAYEKVFKAIVGRQRYKYDQLGGEEEGANETHLKYPSYLASQVQVDMIHEPVGDCRGSSWESIGDHQIDRIEFEIKELLQRQVEVQSELKELKTKQISKMATIARNEYLVDPTALKSQGKKTKSRGKSKKKQPVSVPTMAQVDDIGGTKGTQTEINVNQPVEVEEQVDPNEELVSMLPAKIISVISENKEIALLNAKIEVSKERLRMLEQRLQAVLPHRSLMFDVSRNLYHAAQTANAKPPVYMRRQSARYRGLHPTPDREMNIEDLPEAIRQINNNITRQEYDFISMLLQLPRRQRINLKLFSAICALSEKVSQLEPLLRGLLNRIDVHALQWKMDKAQLMFELIADPAPGAHPGTIPTEQLFIELRAGGLSEEHAIFCIQKFDREKLGYVNFLDYLIFLPLFIIVHESVVNNPLYEAPDFFTPPVAAR